jgi:hypothetical protein
VAVGGGLPIGANVGGTFFLTAGNALMLLLALTYLDSSLMQKMISFES